MALATRERVNGPVNYMEELTDNLLENLLLEYKPKRFSNDAVRDIRALALNRLWPMYTTTDQGRAYIKKTIEQESIEKDVIRELRAAIDIVNAHPRK